MEQEDIKQIIINEIGLKDPIFNTYTLKDISNWMLNNIEDIVNDDTDVYGIEIRTDQLSDWYLMDNEELFNNYSGFNDIELLDMEDYIQTFIFPGAITDEQIHELEDCGLSLDSFVIVDNWNENITVLKDDKERQEYIKNEIEYYGLNNLKSLTIEKLEELTKNNFYY